MEGMNKGKTCQTKADPALCASGCGFYGNPDHRNLCSTCYDDFLRQKIRATSFSISTIMKKPRNPAPESPQSSSLADGRVKYSGCVDVRGHSDEAAKGCNGGDTARRCNSCGKRVGMLGFHCRCGDVFCGKHRHPEEHACGFDSKSAARGRLAKENPAIMGDKLEFRV